MCAVPMEVRIGNASSRTRVTGGDNCWKSVTPGSSAIAAYVILTAEPRHLFCCLFKLGRLDVIEI